MTALSPDTTGHQRYPPPYSKKNRLPSQRALAPRSLAGCLPHLSGSPQRHYLRRIHARLGDGDYPDPALGIGPEPASGVYVVQERSRPGRGPASGSSLLKTATLFLTWLGVLAFMEWQAYPTALKQVMIVIGAGVSLDALASTFFVAFQVQGRQDQESKVKALSCALGFGFGLTCLFLGAPAWLVACFKIIEALVNLAGGVGLAISWYRPRLKWPSLSRLWPILQRGLVFVLLQLAANTYNKANLFFLQRYAGAQVVGQYSATWQIVDGISALVSTVLLQSVLYPLFVRLWEVDKAQVSRLARKATRWLLAIAWPLTFLLYIESDRLIPLDPWAAL